MNFYGSLLWTVMRPEFIVGDGKIVSNVWENIFNFFFSVKGVICVFI